MGIAMFIFFLIMNLFMTLIMKYVFDSNYKYANGMLLGVHIPKDHVQDEEVQNLVTAAGKSMKRFLNWNCFVSVAICFLIFWNFVIFILIFCIWIAVYCIGVEWINISRHRQMYDLKMKNGWLVESQKKVYIDTQLSAGNGKDAPDVKYHFLILTAEIVCFLPFIGKRNENYFIMIFIFFLCSLTVTLAAWILHAFINRSEKTVYSKDTAVNQRINREMKYYKGIGMLLLSLLNGIAWVCPAVMTLASGHFPEAAFYIYIFLSFFSAVCMLLSFLFAKYRKKELLSKDTAPLYVDDDEYWKTGFYYNPNDKHTLVPNRMQSGNYAFNYATKAAKTWTVILTVFIAGCLLVTFAMLIPFLHVHVEITLSDDQLCVSAAGYHSEIALSDITQVSLLDEMPKDDFFKTNGGSTEEYSIGYFKGKTYGTCSLYLNGDDTPILMVQTKETTLFMNSTTDGEIENLYEELMR